MYVLSSQVGASVWQDSIGNQDSSQCYVGWQMEAGACDLGGSVGKDEKDGSGGLAARCR